MLPPEGKAWFKQEQAAGATTTPNKATAANSLWKPWSPQAMQEALDAGKPVYVDYTARWCATCQVNKASYTDEVLTAFEKHGIVLMKADKTKANPDIDAELKKLGRSAIPVNVLYRKDKAPAITIELLTPSYLIEFVDTEMAK